MKMWYIYHIEIYNGILLSHKKEWNFVICSNMDRLGAYYTKRTKSEKDKYYKHLYVESKYNKWVNTQKEANLQIERTNYWLPVVRWGEGNIGVGD